VAALPDRPVVAEDVPLPGLPIRIVGVHGGGAGLRQRSEQGGEFGAGGGGEPELTGPGAVWALGEVQGPAVFVLGLLTRQDPVGVDRFDQLRRHGLQVFEPEPAGLVDQQGFPGVHVDRVAVGDLAQRVVDQAGPLGGDLPVALRGGEVPADRGRGFPERGTAGR
jgi:hypothetical protein